MRVFLTIVMDNVKQKYPQLFQRYADCNKIEAKGYKNMTNHPLDGTYRISTTTSYKGPLEKRSDGETEIRNSQTQRRDDANCKWTSTFEIIDETSVKMTSVADPSEANIDFLLTAPDGTPTREKVVYEALLKLARKGDSQIQISGQVEYGHDVVFLTLRKIDA